MIGFRSGSSHGAVLAGLLLFFASADAVRAELLVKVVPPAREASAGYYRYDLEPGESARGAMLIENSGPETVDVVVYSGDATNTPEGTLIGPLLGAPSTAVGTWITIADGRFQLRSEEERRVEFTLRIPESAEPGDHLGFVFVQEAPKPAGGNRSASARAEGSPSNRGEAQFVLQLATRFGVTVWNRVPGPASVDLFVSEPRKEIVEGRLFLEVDIANRGSRFLKPSGNWTLRSLEGPTVVSTEMEPWGYLVPGGTRRLRIPIATERPLVRGQYELIVESVSGESDGEGQSRRTVFSMELP